MKNKAWHIINYLYTNKNNKITLVYTFLLGFLQSFSASIMIVLATTNNIITQFFAGIVYYSVLTINTQRMAFGNKLGIRIFIVSAAVGFAAGSLLLRILN